MPISLARIMASGEMRCKSAVPTSGLELELVVILHRNFMT